MTATLQIKQISDMDDLAVNQLRDYGSNSGMDEYILLKLTPARWLISCSILFTGRKKSIKRSSLLKFKFSDLFTC